MRTLRQFSPEEIAALHRAFCFYAGGSKRWRALAGTGATDAALSDFISHEMGQGGSGGPRP